MPSPCVLVCACAHACAGACACACAGALLVSAAVGVIDRPLPHQVARLLGGDKQVTGRHVEG